MPAVSPLRVHADSISGDNVFETIEVEGIGTIHLLRRVPDFLLWSASCDISSISHRLGSSTARVPRGSGTAELAYFDGPLEGDYVGVDQYYGTYEEAEQDEFRKGVFTLLDDFYATLHVTYWVRPRLLTIQGACRNPVTGSERHVWITVGMNDEGSSLDPNTLMLVPATSDTLYMGIQFEGPEEERVSAMIFKRYPYRIEVE